MEDKIVNKIEGQPLPWQEDEMFYLMTADGLFVCRNHEYFVSSAPARSGPIDLAEHKPTLVNKYPKVPTETIEEVAGFFHWMYKKDYGEAIVLIMHNPKTGEVKVVAPEQECAWGGVEYKQPPYDPEWRLIGDIHSHVNFSAFSSFTDKNDEEHRPGVHIVLGYNQKEPPEFHVEIVVDGHRFKKDILDVVVDYRAKRNFPIEWTKVVKKKVWPESQGGHREWHGDSDHSGIQRRRRKRDDADTGERWGGGWFEGGY